MANNHTFPIDPMLVFYAMVTAVQEGKVAEIETDFRIEAEDQSSVMVTIVVRRDPKQMVLNNLKEEDNGG